MIIFFLASILTNIHSVLPSHPSPFQAFWIGAIVFFGLGIADARLNLPPIPRLVEQFIIASGVWHLGLRIDAVPIPSVGTVDLGMLSLPITVISIVGLTNAIHWLNGLDRLAVGMGAIAAVFFALLSWQIADPFAIVLSLTLVGTAFVLAVPILDMTWVIGDGHWLTNRRSTQINVISTTVYSTRNISLSLCQSHPLSGDVGGELGTGDCRKSVWLSGAL